MKKLFNTIVNLLTPQKQKKFSHLALSMEAFTNETHLQQINRQGRLYEFSYKARYIGK